MGSFLKGLVVLGIGLGLGGIALAGPYGGGHHGGHYGGHYGGGHAGGAYGGYHGGYHGGGAYHGYHHSGYHGGHYSNYHQSYGHQFSHGYYYPGRIHDHWSYKRWDARYGCTVYYDPYVRCNYYWCEPDACYYPVSYCPYDRYGW